MLGGWLDGLIVDRKWGGGVEGVSGLPDLAFKIVRFLYFESDLFWIAGLRMLDGPGSYTK